MKLVYIANVRIPTEKAHGIQIMEMCRAFSSNGLSVELLVPTRKNNIYKDPFSYYGVQKKFIIKKLPTLDLIRFGKWGYRFQSVVFSLLVCLYLMTRKDVVYVYSRDELPLYFLSFTMKRVAWEAHMGHINFFIKRLIHKRIPIVAISKSLKDFYVSNGAGTGKILVAPDGVNLDQFSVSNSKKDARRMLNFDPFNPLVIYAGHLYKWKGVDTLANAANNLNPNVKIVFVGGTEKHVKSFSKRYAHIKNIEILGQKFYTDIPIYLKAADIAVLPNSAQEEISRLYTSPMKLFEYMASGTPIVASHLPSIKEILDDSMAYFFTPDDPKNLATIITRALQDTETSSNKAKKALEKVQNFSWEKRAKNIIDFYENTSR